MRGGTYKQKINIFKKNFGIDVTKIRVHNNTFTGMIKNKFSITSITYFGSVSKGWSGTVNIQSLISVNETPFI